MTIYFTTSFLSREFASCTAGLSCLCGISSYPRQESNLDSQLRRLVRYPLHHGGICKRSLCCSLGNVNTKCSDIQLAPNPKQSAEQDCVEWVHSPCSKKSHRKQWGTHISHHKWRGTHTSHHEWRGTRLHTGLIATEGIGASETACGHLQHIQIPANPARIAGFNACEQPVHCL